MASLPPVAQPRIVNNITCSYDGTNYYQPCAQGSDMSQCEGHRQTMVEKEYQPLIDRDTSTGHVQTHFAGILEVFRDMVNYGSNLIPQCFISSNRRIEDAIILGVLLRQAVAMFDAIEILISNAAVYPCYLQTRAIFEASLSLEWILKADTEKKAKYYYVANVRRDRVWASRTQRGSPENLAFEKTMAPFGNVIPDTTNRLGAGGQEYLREINRILAQPSFAAIDRAIDSYRAKNKFRYDPAWYVPLGPRSVRQLAEILQRLHEYEMVYVESSENHALHISEAPYKVLAGTPGIYAY